MNCSSAGSWAAAGFLLLWSTGTLSAAEPQRLTHDGRQKMDPVFLRGGEELVFTVLESSTQLSLMRLKLTDGSVERLHPQATTSEFEAAFAPDGQSYTFVRSQGNLNLKLIIRDTKQNRDALFDPGGGFASVRRPCFTADSSRVLFSIPSPTGQQLASVNLQGQDRRTILQGGINNWPACSPDGRRLAFASSRDGDFEIYVANLDGSDLRRLTNSPGLDMRPAWSPDSSRLAFTSARDGNYEIYVLNADGSGLRRITQHPERDDFASWHPDGKHVVFVGERAGRFDLYLAEVP